MNQKIVMKTNLNKTSTGLKIPVLPKPAKGSDRLVAGLIDLAMIYVLHKLVLMNFDLRPSYGAIHPELPRAIAVVFLYGTYIVIPDVLFCQSVGKFIMKLKVVREEDYKRMGLFTGLFRDLLLKPFVLVLPFVILNKEGRGFHDKMAGTIVVSAK